MRKQLLLAIAFSLGIWAYLLAGNPPRNANAAHSNGPASEDGITALFSPSGGCTDAIVSEIGKAAQAVDIQAYAFTSQPVAQAVADAAARGVRVRVILDKAQRTDHASAAEFLASHNVPVYIDDQHALAHNKVLIIDGNEVITGSFNLTKSAEERNAENLLILRGRPKLAATYESNFEHHLFHSSPLAAPKQ
ncbi:MAG: phosphatidylserine/phosphatidylglycerophosphate/cardioli pin synthase [Phycisphaerales bacterium]|nr:phosphatidylserine/phosphatidylglycerophosphate/cardioli pin synthase [Phycisphaerales bacterium]